PSVSAASTIMSCSKNTGQRLRKLGGVLAALKKGVPLVIVPTEWDRPENALRVVEAGAGLRIAATGATRNGFGPSWNVSSTGPSFRNNARRVAAVFPRNTKVWLSRLIGKVDLNFNWQQ